MINKKCSFFPVTAICVAILAACGSDEATPNIAIQPTSSLSEGCVDGQTTSDGANSFVCSGGQWIPQEPANPNTTSSCAEGTNSSNEGNDYVCSGGQWIQIAMTDSRDGQKYKTVTIGGKTWMAQNLNYAQGGVPWEVFQFGNTLAFTSNDQPIIGRLYNLGEAKAVCPSGWHLPDTTDWMNLLSSIADETKMFYETGVNKDGALGTIISGYCYTNVKHKLWAKIEDQVMLGTYNLQGLASQFQTNAYNESGFSAILGYYSSSADLTIGSAFWMDGPSYSIPTIIETAYGTSQSLTFLFMYVNLRVDSKPGIALLNRKVMTGKHKYEDSFSPSECMTSDVYGVKDYDGSFKYTESKDLLSVRCVKD